MIPTHLRKQFKLKKCRYCGTKNNLTIDHKIPIIQGGKNELKNFQCLCYRCNSMKSGMSDKQVRRLWQWFNIIQNDRESNGKKQYFS